MSLPNSRQDTLNIQIKFIDVVSTSYSCQQCLFTTKIKENLFKHEETKHRPEMSENYLFTNIDNDEEGIDRTDEEVCDDRSTVQQATQHVQQTYHCTHCESVFKSQIDLKLHYGKIHKQLTFSCDHNFVGKLQHKVKVHKDIMLLDIHVKAVINIHY